MKKLNFHQKYWFSISSVFRWTTYSLTIFT
jgi:hypothetical protein